MTSQEIGSVPLKVLNINVGLLGHVDSGKTSLAKCLSKISSTACFDKHPQSQERGITIDLGFSSFSSIPPSNILEQGFEKIQYTLVDCPGHASLIRTIIGGIHIIDVVVLVIDVTKGVQTQTAECLVISQIANRPLIIALNKIDLIESEKRDELIKKAMKKLGKTLSNTPFKEVPIIPVVAKENTGDYKELDLLIQTLNSIVSVPERRLDEPLVLAVDHCFLIRGKGTILTGTVLQGSIKVNDIIEIPALQETKKVKSIQMFKQDVSCACQGDRIGICVKQFEPSQIERAVVGSPGYISLLYGAIISFNKVEYYKGDISSNAKYHISIGYETLIGKLTIFSSDNNQHFNIAVDYAFREKYIEELKCNYYGLLEFEKPIYIAPNSIIIGSKLDMNINLQSCRLAFYGNIVEHLHDKNYATSFLPNLRLFIIKEKIGHVINLISENEVIAYRLFKKIPSMQRFINFKVRLSTGELGIIQGSFGQKDKVRIQIPDGLKPSTLETLSMNKKHKKSKLKGDEPIQENNEKKEAVKVILRFKKYIYDKDKSVNQHLII